ncbi:hypothetical protein EQW78_16465 [Oerskovia turbata]|uniref:Alkaline shock response membrane anchor protein AmaP n=1 Tax=Oerskovia turbata TaxID=1713 RepID=A0A4Q1KRN9_9CELL|nr:hypothetical protein [Oerskovia turbata]RXR26048.1 hypothetical protein EQW73_06700 [Oerskovia turbata]RXR31644.1 hypothetical protein EQW78_16465 [Oerskovia turbata]TGJ97250.1 hypothetical protein DLJ96_04400 [Actinotalea fermentans ATCC 43279 = JCM 9966 = DSM 3133]
MNRTVLRLDRVLLALFGLVLVVVGVAALLWTTGTLAEYVDGVPDSLDTSGATTAASQTWWPYATGAVALLLAIVAVWWMLAHLPARSVPEQDLPGSSRAMRLRIDRGAVADATAHAAQQIPSVRRSTATLRDEGSELVLSLLVTVDPATDLPDLATRLDDLVADAATVLPDERLRSRTTVRMRTSRRSDRGSRVE